jgi:small GTP-binding protein
MKTKINLVGEASVGKTSLIRRFVLDEFEDKYLHTVGTKVTKVQLTIPHENDEVDMSMVVFDIMGQKGFRDMIKETFYHGSQGLLCVCDVTRRDTLDALHDWITSATAVCGDVPKYVLVNKKDLLHRADFGERDVAKVAEMWDAPYVYTSAKTGEQVDDAFNILAIDIVEQAFRRARTEATERELHERMLDLIAQRGYIGVNRDMFFEHFRGIKYDQLVRELQRLERQALIQISWRGPADFTALITPIGERKVRAERRIG